jgi:hypothetical protein
MEINENSLASNSSVNINKNPGDSENLDKTVLAKIYEDGKNGVFKPKIFEFGEESKSYTPVVAFFKCETNFESRPSKKIKMKCLICNKNFHAKVGRFTNLNRHISTDHKDSETVEWYKNFCATSSKSKDCACLDEDMLLLIKYFISSNNSIVELKNKFFKKLMIKAKMKTPDYRTFVNKLLPKVMDEIHKTILKKLRDATCISLITDIWTNKQLKDFIAVAANIINEKFEKQLLVIGISRMPGKHNAENVKIGIN